MKRLIFITALLVVSFTSDAQVVIRTNKDKNVKTVSSTVIKKEVIYKERKLYDAKVGFQQFIELSSKFGTIIPSQASNFRAKSLTQSSKTHFPLFLQ